MTAAKMGSRCIRTLPEEHGLKAFLPRCWPRIGRAIISPGNDKEFLATLVDG